MIERHVIHIEEIPGPVPVFVVSGYPGEAEVFLCRDERHRWHSLFPPALTARRRPTPYWPGLVDLVEHAYPEVSSCPVATSKQLDLLFG